jgi:hypothetical protein
MRHKDRKLARRASAVLTTSAIVVLGISTAWASGSSWLRTYDPGPFGAPQEVAFSPTDAWITDPANNALVEVNPETGRVVRMVQGKQGRFDAPVPIAASSAGVWVDGEGPAFANTIAELNSSSGAYVRSITLRGALMKNAGGDLAVCGGHLWTVGESQYFEFSIASGKLQRVVDLRKKGIWLGGELTVEGNDLWDAGGKGRTNVAVELSCSSSVLKVLHIGNSSVEDVEGLAVGGDHLWITTYRHHSLLSGAAKEFNTTTGALIRTIPSAKYHLDTFDYNTVAESGNVLCIVGSGGGRVALLSASTGSLIKTVSSHLFDFPIEFVAADHGDFWLLESEGRTVVVISAKTGRIVHYLGPTGGS